MVKYNRYMFKFDSYTWIKYIVIKQLVVNLVNVQRLINGKLAKR